MAGFSLRAPVQDVNPNPPTGPPKVNSTCPAGQIIFAEGNTKFSQLDPNGYVLCLVICLGDRLGPS
jgi:hypothetical protein